ncbi:MAG: glutamine--tRNA ligase/YqeY domain fusion protein [Flavobacteriaceae bacterium]
MSDTPSKHFIEHIIDEDLAAGLNAEALRFRFPPEPNGYLHIGHVKAICLNFELGKKYNAPVNLRFDDTNPAKEEQHFVDAIRNDVAWLGYSWDNECYASDYFEQLYSWAVQLIKDGHAYVDPQTPEKMAEQKGTPATPGTASPYREQSSDEALRLFEEMKAGKHSEGSLTLRFKGDMASPNMLLRDPILYRILHKSHHRTGANWCIYPMYDWAHGQSDYIEQISHSLCTLEFKPHRDLYDAFLDKLVHEGLRPKQREFARLNLNYTITSKRKLQRLVEEQKVSGWDDPRMPTISGLRRRGYTPTSLRKFAETVGIAKRENVIDASLLEFCVREDLNKTATRAMAVLNPIKVVITNYPEDKTEALETENNPEDTTAGTRTIPFGKTLFIEQDDFKEEASRKFFRLKLGGEVRLKSAYIIKAESVEKDAGGNITTVFCTYDPKSLSGSGTPESQRKVKATIHWVETTHTQKIEVREYDRLFKTESPDEDKDVDFMTHLNPESFAVKTALAEPMLASAEPGNHFQFQRLGYFVCDKDSTASNKVFNKTVGLRDTWEKQRQKPQQAQPKQDVKPIEELKRLGKKFMNLPAEKQEAAINQITGFATQIPLDALEPLFQTAAKKTGTRLVTLLALVEHLNAGAQPTQSAIDFIHKAQQDRNEILAKTAQDVQI